MKLDARQCILLSCLFIKLKNEADSHVSVIFTVIQNAWLATNSQNAILKNLYICFSSIYILQGLGTTYVMYTISNSNALKRENGTGKLVKQVLERVALMLSDIKFVSINLHFI